MKEITSSEQFETVSKQGKSIMMFTADWCKDCVFIEPFLPSIVEAHPDYQFYKIDCDKLMKLSRNLRVLGIPSFVAFADGAEIGRLVSRERKTKEEIEDFIKSL